MSMFSNPNLVVLRRLLRRLGIARWVSALVYGRDYEAAYQQGLLGAVRAGDHVWDVGANRGYYALKFAELVGEGGTVTCFEPNPRNVHALEDLVKEHDTIGVLAIGLGDADGEVSMLDDGRDTGVASRVADTGAGAAAGEVSLAIPVRRPDTLLTDRTAVTPNVLKIDVEGYELHVLRGFGEHLRSDTIRCIGVEVHFRLLEAHWQSEGPKQIEALLKNAGFRVTWPDPSHVLAVR